MSLAPSAVRPPASAPRAVVVVEGDVDVATAGRLREVLGSAMGGPSTTVVLDVSGVSFLDCAGLRELLAARARLVAGGRGLRLRSPSPAVLRLLRLTGDEGRFEVEGALDLDHRSAAA